MRATVRDQMGRTCVDHRGLRLCVQRSHGVVMLNVTRLDAQTGEYALRIALGAPGLNDEDLLKQIARLGDLFAGARNIDP
jgi:hypothetical protein